MRVEEQLILAEAEAGKLTRNAWEECFDMKANFACKREELLILRFLFPLLFLS